MSLLRTEPVVAYRYWIIMGTSGSALETALSMAASLAAEAIFDGGFSECTGMGSEQELYTYQEGGLIDKVHRLPGRTTHGNITLKWGMGFNNSLWEWHFNNARALSYGTSLKRKDGTIIGLPYAGIKDPLSLAAGAQVWYFRRGLPVRWTGPQFNATANQVGIESIEIAHEGLERWFPPNLSFFMDLALDKVKQLI
ncbi:MAG: hypothetical protein JWN15_1951 [Firmicutes bacterium]|nr:hypothetical protein [Bacillota bacterium]